MVFWKYFYYLLSLTVLLESTVSQSQLIGIESEPSCVIPKVANGTIVIIGNENNTLPDTVLSGTEIVLFCDDGFTPRSNLSSIRFVCQDEFVWSDVDYIFCSKTDLTNKTVANCTVPVVENGTVAIYTRNGRFIPDKNNNGTVLLVASGTQLRLACNGLEYDLKDGERESVCVDGIWSTKLGICKYIVQEYEVTTVKNLAVTTTDTADTVTSTVAPVTNGTVTNEELTTSTTSTTTTSTTTTSTTTTTTEVDVLNVTTASSSTLPASTSTPNSTFEIESLVSNITVIFTNYSLPTLSTLNVSGFENTTASTSGDSLDMVTADSDSDDDDGDNKTTETVLVVETVPNRTLSDVELLFAAIASDDVDKVANLLNVSQELVDSIDNTTSETPLLAAVRAESIPIVELLLNKGADVEAKDPLGQTAVTVAAKIGLAPIVELLLYTNARIEDRDPELGRTPLLWAASLGHTEVVKRLVENSADIMVRSDSDGKEDADGLAIHLAAAKGYVDIVDYLLERNRTALIEARNEKFETPLMVASSHGKINVVGRLVQKHTSALETRTPYNKTALMKAIANDHLAIVKFLVRSGANISTKCIGKRTGLHLAVELNLTRIAKYLSHKESKLMEETNMDGNTPLYLASQAGQIELVQYFLERGANVPRVGYLGRTAIHAAAAAGHVDIVRLLAEKQRGRIWAQSKPEDNGDMAIHLAIRNHHLEVVKLLLAMDEQQIEAQNLHNHTPLQLAIIIGDVNMCCYIAGLNSDKEMRDSTGQTPLIVAAGLGNEEIVRCLVEAGANSTSKSSLQDSGNTPLHAAASKGSLGVIKLLVTNVSRELLEVRDAQGATPLISAVLAGQLEAVKTLVELGANLEATTYLSIKTALWLAASTGDVPIVEYLITRGANMEAVGEYGRTPLLASAAAGHLEVTRFLIENGANWKAVSGDIDGLNTALHLASAFGHFEVSRYLSIAKPELVNVANKRGHTAAQLATLLWNKNIHSASVRRYQSTNQHTSVRKF